MIQNANSLMTEMMRIQLEKRRLEMQLKTRRPQEEESSEQTTPAGIAEGDIEDMIDRSPAVAKLEAELQTEEARYNAHIAELRQISRKIGDPQARKLLNDVNATRAVLKKKRAEMRPLAIEELQAQHKDQQVKAGNDDFRLLAELTELETSLKAELKNLQEQSKTLNTKTLDLTALSEEVSQLLSTSSQVSTEVEALNVELQAPPRVRTIEDAVPPMTRDERKRTATIILIVVGSFSPACSESRSSNCKPRRSIRSTSCRPSSDCRSLARCPWFEPNPLEVERWRVSQRRKTATGTMSSWNQLTPCAPCWCTRRAWNRTAW